MKHVILLVEDDADARASLARSLEREGLHCLCAADVEEAVALVQRQGWVDAIVTDMVLGRDPRGGLAVMKRLAHARRAAPTIVITAFADVERVKEALNEGAQHLLEKPFAASELIAVLKRLIAEGQRVDGLVEHALLRAHLTQRETEIARLVLKGLTSAEIARVLGNSDKTVRQHITQIYAKMGVSSRAELFHFVFPS